MIQMVSFEMGAALFLLGVASGIALHRLLMAMVLGQSPDSIRSYRKWMETGKQKHRRL